MIYLTKEDLELDAWTRLIDESTGFDDTLLDSIETKVIARCKTFLTRYDVEDAFNEDEPVRDEHLVDIMVKIFLKMLFGRNSARKMPSDVKENYDWAIKELEKIQQGKITIILPPKIDPETGTTAPLMWGNFSNRDFYI